jgi:hypothetical protein
MRIISKLVPSVIISKKFLVQLAITFILIFSFCYAENSTRLIEHDLGDISPKKLVKLKFQFKETIKDVTTLCDCVKAWVYKKEESNRDILYIVNVEFDPREYLGEIQQDILLLEENDNLITLRLKAVVVQ